MCIVEAASNISTYSTVSCHVRFACIFHIRKWWDAETSTKEKILLPKHASSSLQRTIILVRHSSTGKALIVLQNVSRVWNAFRFRMHVWQEQKIKMCCSSFLSYKIICFNPKITAPYILVWINAKLPLAFVNCKCVLNWITALSSVQMMDS